MLLAGCGGVRLLSYEPLSFETISSKKPKLFLSIKPYDFGNFITVLNGPHYSIPYKLGEAVVASYRSAFSAYFEIVGIQSNADFIAKIDLTSFVFDATQWTQGAFCTSALHKMSHRIDILNKYNNLLDTILLEKEKRWKFCTPTGNSAVKENDRSLIAEMSQEIYQHLLSADRSGKYRLDENTILITSTPPGVNIYLDESYRGVTPLSIKLSKGSHDIKLEKDDYETLSETFRVSVDGKHSYSLARKKVVYIEAPKVTISSPIPLVQSQRWAVVIGISDYQDTRIPSLRYAATDAKAFYDYLISPNGGKYAPAKVKLLLNQNATGWAFKNALFVWLQNAIEEDMVTIYFASHGSPESPDSLNNLFLLPYDSQYDNIAATGSQCGTLRLL
jgi:hypothetical protein